MLLLGRVVGLVPPTSIARQALSAPQALQGALLRPQRSRAFASLRMEEVLPGLDATNALTVDTLRPRPLLQRCIKEAPSEPGVYVMESAEGSKLYIGKSVNLSSRVPSYFSSSCEDCDKEPVVVATAVLPGTNLSRRIAVMTTLVERIDYIATASGAEALLLEASMIRQHQPPFNVLLKDDKRNYPYVCVTWSEPYPRLLITRDKPRRGGGPADRYYGPFVDPGQLKSTVALVRRVLPLRERHRPLYKDKPCLNYDMGICPGACQGLISEDNYADTVRLAEMVFRGEGGELLSRLQERMEAASRAEQFERAGDIKAQMELVRGGLLGSALHFSSGGTAAGWGRAEDDDSRGGRAGASHSSLRRDVVAVGLAGDLACFQVFRVRDGRLTDRLGFTYRVDEGLSRGEVLQACLERYWGDALESSASLTSVQGIYRRRESRLSPYSWAEGGKQGGVHVVDVPDEVVTADPLPDGGAAMLADLLSAARKSAADAQEAIIDSQKGGESAELERRGNVSRKRVGNDSLAVKVVHGEGTGERHHLCVMVLKNAELEAKRLRKGGEATREGLSQLAHMLGLASPPARIEGYDVSHTGGGQAVASVVCFVDGKVSPKGHRRYGVKSPDVRKGHSDDYASLREVIARRFAPPPRSRRRSSATTTAAADPNPVPDVVLIDGGKGQLTAALEGAAIAADAWRSVGTETANDGEDDHAKDAERAEALPAETVAVAGVVVQNNKAHASSSFPAPSQLKGGYSAQEDPDAVLLAAAPSREPLNGHTGMGSSVHVGGGREVMFASLAKKDEEVFVPWAREPLAAAVEAGPSSPGVMILRQVRDEAHRFAVAYHRKLRGRDMFLPERATGMAEAVPSKGGQEGFEGIAGLPSKSRDALVNTFGSLDRARVAGEAELRRIPGIGPTLAKRILGDGYVGGDFLEPMEP